MPRNGDKAEARQRARVEASILVRTWAEPPEPNDTVKIRITRAAKRLGWSVGRTEDIWRGEAHHIESFEMDKLRTTRPDA